MEINTYIDAQQYLLYTGNITLILHKVWVTFTHKDGKYIVTSLTLHREVSKADAVYVVGRLIELGYLQAIIGVNNTLFSWDWSILSTSVEENILLDIQPTTSGINIIGGYAKLRWYDTECVFKKLQRKDILTAMCVDRVKPLFKQPAIGERYAKMDINRVLGTITLTSGWYLFMRKIIGVSMTEYVKDKYGAHEKKLWLPTDRKFVLVFLEAFLLRMVCGVKDPGPTNWIVTNGGAIYSIDEASGFHPDMAPGGTKRWLQHNLAGKQALTVLKDYSEDVIGIQSRWSTISVTTLASTLDILDDKEDATRRAEYIYRNILSLVEDFNVLVGLVTPTIVANNSALFGEVDLLERYYRASIYGYNTSVVKSALQKSIRRGLVEEAIFWGCIMLGSFGIENEMNRLLVIASEDISIANNDAVICGIELADYYWNLRAEQKIADKKEPLYHLGSKVGRWKLLRDSSALREKLHKYIVGMCKSSKSRITDHIAGLYFKGGTFSIGNVCTTLDIAIKTNTLEDEAKVATEIGYLFSNTPKDAYSNMDKVYVEMAKRSSQLQGARLVGVFESLRRIATHRMTGTKVKGRTQLAHALLLFTRPKAQLLFGGMLEATIDVENMYKDVISGKLRLSVPVWAHDKHTGATQTTKEFYVKEQTALVPLSTIVIDNYYSMVI